MKIIQPIVTDSTVHLRNGTFLPSAKLTPPIPAVFGAFFGGGGALRGLGEDRPGPEAFLSPPDGEESPLRISALRLPAQGHLPEGKPVCHHPLGGGRWFGSQGELPANVFLTSFNSFEFHLCFLVGQWRAKMV